MARSDPRPSVRVTRGAGSGQHLASVLQEGRENANIDAGLGFIWRISGYTFPLSRRPYRSLSCNMRARRFLFPTIPTRRTLSVTNVTSLVFIFDLHLLDNDLHFLDS